MSDIVPPDRLVIDYDRLDLWGPIFTAIVTEVAGHEIIAAAKRPCPQYIEDARHFFEQEIGVQPLVDGLSECLRPHSVRVYHGTRLSELELKSVQRLGLQPLTLARRKPLLIGLFEQHEDWPKVKDNFEDIIHQLGVGWEKSGNGKREDDGIHVCLSQAGLLNGFNHYLTHGAEVDQHVASLLFGSERARELLRAGRVARLISFEASFDDAAGAANPHGFFSSERDAAPSVQPI
jgi:hypothetical protein